MARTGQKYYGPSGATTWSSATLDLKRNLIYVMTGNGYSDPEIKTADAIIAMDLNTGAIRRSQQAMSDMFNWDRGLQFNLVGVRGPGGGNCPEHPGVDVEFGSSIDGMLFVSSGYSGIPGNALLAFAVPR